MNGYDAKSKAIIAGICAIHRELSKPELVTSYKKDYSFDDRQAESALLGIAREITYPMWVDWQAIQIRNKQNNEY